ncbi:MAG: hypothetical protein JXA96_16800 [Sedimentisphaerales bacterium]|nr:hypothetical protein [Sedimentisphaerales bacterium]
MAKKKTNKKNVVKYDIWQLLQILFGIGIIISLVLLTLELTKPMELKDNIEGYYEPNITGDTGTSGMDSLLPPDTGTITIRSGLFKPEIQYNDKPLADKTIQAIKSRLTLLCILDNEEGEPEEAFVKIQGEGLKQCYIGDTVSDLFTVLSIEEKSITISIVDHEVKLRY